MMAIGTTNYKTSFEAIALTHLDRLYYMAFQLTKNRADAEDLVQETYLKAYRFYRSFTPGTNFKAWITKILYNNFVNFYRKRNSVPPQTELSRIARTLTDQSAATKETQPDQSPLEIFDDDISRALLKLPLRYRQVIMLVDVQNLNYKETAQVLKCPAGTVMSRLSRARAKLRHLLANYEF